MFPFSQFADWWRQTWACNFIQSTISKPSTDDEAPEDTALGFENQDGTPGEPFTLQRGEQFGDVRIPPKNSGCIILRKRDGGVMWSINMPRWRPKGYKIGDRGIHSDKAGTEVHLHGTQSATAGAVEVKANGATITIDKDGHITLVPAAGFLVKLGDGVAANLDNLVLFAALKGYVDTHTHGPGAYVAPLMGGAVTGTSGAPTSPLGVTARSSNALAKK